MAISIEFADDAELQARIKVVGVGGSGGNALNTMITSGLEGVEFIAANTDAQALEGNLAPNKIQLGPQLTKGLGAGGNPDVGRKSALEDVQRIADSLAGADMVFVTAGMGGGTGTGAAPIIAQVARDQGALTVGVVTKPFLFEGRKRSKNASNGILELGDAVDSIITIPNQKLLCLGDDDLSMLDAFQRADDVLLQAVQGISDLITTHGMINVDFADVRTIMSSQGRALMGTGYAKGEHRAQEAAEIAINSPLLDDISVDGAQGILINFTAGPDVKLREIEQAASLVQQAAHEEAEIIFGLVTDPDMQDLVKVTVIATGFEEASQQVASNREQRQALPLGSAVRQATRQATRPSAYGTRDSSRPSRRPAERPAPAPAAAAGTRAFGASALHDEAVLDIPAYMRRSSAPSE
ncbi:MAG TPA: cell division protein FtsZ [Polyangiaceae bacterium LLY-WYZ-15_(1-7)]|nr:cell division protein FtsZ [Myxococcales bacterium]MBJ71086.1 cell division protein FtsZ [Sandaracinus sp.]HJL01175.1 cell division protein FtsZ [Polyangiaceae bacterium LLY-WYZ-15_(1-7)]HJL10026.1 cell division protein FtsZ [Polyangiaceae bacterium LLY-WYZ-15_(1-7)]HJL23666.1 cell division protein FtsZ [Polyangiaceae bacterium LLY-WYZ-15_(1-7)]